MTEDKRKEYSARARDPITERDVDADGSNCKRAFRTNKKGDIVSSYQRCRFHHGPKDDVWDLINEQVEFEKIALKKPDFIGASSTFAGF